MEMQELCQKLETFGLEAGEARLYFYLSRLGPSRASDLAEQAGVHRTDVYRMADGLVRKGFAEKTLERPVRFVPQGLAEVLEKRREAQEATLREETQAAKTLINVWPAQAKSWGSGAQRFAVHQGMPHIRSLFERMIDHAEEELVLVMNRRGLAKLGVGDTLSRLARRAAQGISVRILTKVDAANVAELRQIASECAVRHVALSGYHQMLLVDNKEIALFVGAGKRHSATSAEETVLWLNAQDFVLAQKALVDRAWTTGIPHNNMSVALSQQRVPPGLDILRGHWVIISKVKQMLSRCEQAVLMVPWEVRDAWWKHGIGRVVAARREAGCHIRVLVHGDVPHDLEDEMHIKRGLPFPVVVTKDGETLMVRPGPDPVEGEDQWATYAAFPDVAGWAWDLMESMTDEVLHVST